MSSTTTIACIAIDHASDCVVQELMISKLGHLTIEAGVIADTTDTRHPSAVRRHDEALRTMVSLAFWSSGSIMDYLHNESALIILWVTLEAAGILLDMATGEEPLDTVAVTDIAGNSWRGVRGKLRSTVEQHSRLSSHSRVLIHIRVSLACTIRLHVAIQAIGIIEWMHDDCCSNGILSLKAVRVEKVRKMCFGDVCRVVSRRRDEHKGR